MQFRQFAILFSFILLNIRNILNPFQIETLWLTILINILIIISINYRKVKYGILITLFLIPLIIYNKEILAPIDILLYVYLLKEISIKQLALINIVTLSLGLTLICWSLGIGLILNHEWIMPKGIAFDFGFANPNISSRYIFFILINLYLFIHPRCRFLLPIFILLVSYITYNNCISRTYFIGEIILVIIHFLVLFRLVKSFVKYIIVIFPIIIICMSIYLCLNLSEYMELDQLFSSRLTIYAGLINNMSIVNWIIGMPTPTDEPMDSSYLTLLFNGGIILLSLFFGTMSINIIKCFRYLNPYLPVILSMLACGVTENIFSSATSTSVLFWLLLFHNRRNTHQLNLC